MKSYINYITMAMFLFIISCSDKEEDPGNDTTTPVAEGTLLMHLHTFYDDEEVQAYQIPYSNNSGRMMSLSLAQFYISGFELEKPDGSYISVAAKNILKVQDVQTYLIGKVPAGNYQRVRFRVGLKPSDNQMNPESSSDSSILNRSEMWFSGTAQPDGYVFMHVQGSIDTTSDNSAGATVPFIYKIGTDAHYQQVTLPARNFTIVKDQAEYIHLYADLNRLLSGVDLSNPANLSILTPQDNASPLASAIAANMEHMFVYE